MASNTCWKCFSRLQLSGPATKNIRPHSMPANAFSTSTSRAAMHRPPPKAPGIRKRAVLNIKKGKAARQGKGFKAPAPGERKALRKRVVLSNTNAFEVPDLKDVAPSNFAQQELAGSMVGLPNDLIDQLRAVESFKPTQGWGYFRRPAALVRKETLELAKVIDRTDGNAEAYRRIITGERGSGKSVLMLQAHAMAFLKKWVVIHLPEAVDLTSATTAYSSISNTEPQSYAQRAYIQQLLSQIAKANEKVLSKIQLSKAHDVGKPLQDNLSLAKLCEAGAADAEISWEVFEAFWSELQVKGRPPVLFTLDGLAPVSRFSEYLTADMHYIHAHDLSIAGHFIKCLSGQTSLGNGGMVLAAESQSNRASSPALRFVIRVRRVLRGEIAGETLTAEQAKEQLKKLADPEAIIYDPTEPYTALDQRTLRALLGVETTPLAGLSREEAKTVLEYYAKSGMLRATVDEATVAQRWTTSGGGIVGELEKGSVKRAMY